MRRRGGCPSRKRPRDAEERSDRDASAAARLLYIRAGRICDRVHDPTPFQPAPTSPRRDPISPSLCVSVVELRVHNCALLIVSTRDQWLCVLPRWRINVNVLSEREKVCFVKVGPDLR